jgi:hypothetical protein
MRKRVVSPSSSGGDEIDKSTKPDAPWLDSSVRILTLHYLNGFKYSCLNGVTPSFIVMYICCISFII